MVLAAEPPEITRGSTRAAYRASARSSSIRFIAPFSISRAER
jgi:hypothetical protein